MMSDSNDSRAQDNLSEETDSVGRLFLPSLVLTRFATQPTGVVLSLLLIEIGLTFGLPVGVTGQIGTVRSITAFVSSLIMGLLSVRYKHKSLLLMGLLLLSVAIIGCYLSPSFALLMSFYVMIGFGTAMIMPMTTSLVAKHLPLEKRTSALGLLMATVSISILLGTPIIRFISDIGGWRLPYLLYALPFPLLSLVLVFKGLPSESERGIAAPSRASVIDGYRGVLSNRSAMACLVSNALAGATFSGITLYGVSFYREYFLLSKGAASYFIIGAALIYTLGSLVCSRFVNKLGRKQVTYLSALMAGIFTFIFTVIPVLWFSLVLTLLACLFAGIRQTAHVSLIIEQVPEFRGTIMSLSAAFINLGTALGSGLAGLSLLWYSYVAVGPTLGLFGIASAFIVYLMAVDPTQIQS